MTERTGGAPAGGVTLREMRWWDLDAVLALEHELFPEDAWSRGMFWSELADARHPAASRTYVIAEAEGAADAADLSSGAADRDAGERADERADEGATSQGAAPVGAAPRVVGYAGFAAVAGTGDVQTIATARDHWGTGLGSRLLTALLRAATAAECHEVLLEVRVDNTRAQRLYQRFGFEPIGLRRGYYQPGNVDALVMRLADPAQTFATVDVADVADADDAAADAATFAEES